jgi:hypothetical protein
VSNEHVIYRVLFELYHILYALPCVFGGPALPTSKILEECTRKTWQSRNEPTL